jgi:hypothetical protein
MIILNDEYVGGLHKEGVILINLNREHEVNLNNN